MRAKTNALAVGVRQALLLGISGTAIAWVPAHAQDSKEGDKPTTLTTMTVTGSRVRRVETETSSPVFAIDKQALERTGKVTIGDLLQSAPSMSGAATNPQVNNGGGDGAARVSLRGLGEVRTLLLLDGRRVAYDDVNSIPVSMVERVEILKDGASAIYGSDAIGGVVNFITKKEMHGAEATLNYGISDHDDGQRQGASFTWGGGDDRANLMVNFNYNKQNEVRAADRKFSFFALTLYSGSVVQGGSSRTTTGRYSIPRTLAAANGINCSGTSTNVAVTRRSDRPGTAIGDFRCFDNGTDLFNYQAVGNLELTPQERAGLFVKGDFQINDNVQFYGAAHTQNTRSKSQIAPLPFDGRPANDNVVLSRNSIYNPFGVDIIDSRLRLSRIGNRTYDYRTDYKEVTGGLKGAFGESGWNWDANYTWGKYTQDATTTGYLVSSRLIDALGPSYVDSTGAHCGTPSAPIANCLPIDFFGAPPDPSTAAGQAQLNALAAIAPNTTNRVSSKFQNFQGIVTGDLFELPAGNVGAAFGVEYRKQYYTFKPDFLANINSNFTCEISSEACTAATSGNITTKEVYGEALVPIVKDVAFAKAVNLTVGTRYSDYDTSGNTTNSKIGLEWRVIDDLLIRGTVAEVFRAPRIVDLFGGRFASSDGFTDPCNGYRPGTAGAPLPVACQNVATDGSFSATDTQLSAFHQGTASLKPEQGQVITWGFVYDPSWLQGFSTTVDVWRVQLSDTIGTIGTQNILNACARSGSFCNLFSRDENGEIIRLFDFNTNVGTTDTAGVDIGFKYSLDTDYGRFRTSVDTTYIDKYNVRVYSDGNVIPRQHLAGSFLSSANGGLGNYSRWRGLGNVTWNKGPWEASWTTRYIHGFVVGGPKTHTCADAGPGQDPDTNPACTFERGAQTYHNVQGGYFYEPWKAKLTAGIDNAFDKKPPILYQNNTLNGNTDERTFDTVGRFYWVNLAVSF